MAVVPPPSAPALVRVPVPPGALSGLPGEENLLAWTVDDGTDAEVIRRYVKFASQTGTRLTFFVTGTYTTWDQTADLLRPLVESGQIQLGNHTWTHPDLTTRAAGEIARELQQCHDFITTTWDVDPRPFYRPPYGYHDDRVDAVAASLGYTAPTLWYGSLADSGLISEQQIVELANQWFLPQHLIIGHLNHEPVTNVFPQLGRIITDRQLRTVTLNDVFTTQHHP